jgi:dTDP-4-dehydrorhamnose 3,5-epimerase
MEIHEKKLKGVYEIQLKPHFDPRGFFMRTYDSDIMKKAGLHREWVHENHSKSEKKGTIRGLHFQFPPLAETKLVRCIRGSIYDVFLDLREGSETFGQWDSIELSEENKKILFIPRGFAHGFCTLTHMTEVVYKADNVYSPGYEGGIYWNDTDLGINWPNIKPSLSEKDKKNITFRMFCDTYRSLKVHSDLF